MDPVFSGIDHQFRISRDPDTVIGLDPMRLRVDRVTSSRDDKIVFGHNPMSRRGGYCERTRSVQRKILFGKNHRINIIIINGGECTAVGKRILRAVRKGDKHFIRRQDIQRRGSLTVDLRSVQY